VKVEVGPGFTVIVKVEGELVQLNVVEVTVIVAITGVVPKLTAVNAGIFPVSLACNPMVVSLFVQEKEAPGSELINEVAGIKTPLQTTIFDGTVTVDVGLIVIVKETARPVQLLAVGVTVIVAVIGIVSVLVAVNEGKSPVPFAPSPIDVLLLVQENVVPGVGLVKTVAGTVDPSHETIFA